MPVSTVTLHPATVHFPIALLLVGSAAGLIYLHNIRGLRRSEVLVLTWWPLRLGLAGLLAAILTGLLAQRNLPPQAAYTPVLNWHIGVGVALLVLYSAVLYRGWLHGKGNRPRTGPDLLDEPGARLWLTLALAAGIVLVVLVGWLGGELVYRWGVNVANA